MKKYWLAAVITGCITFPASSQTLFTYGKYKADAAEFLRTFSKNNQQPAADKSKALQEYLDLYIDSRLKIREAYDRGYDTLPQVKYEMENLRNQVIGNYMSDPQVIERLTREAFLRSLKDIHAAHIFIAAAPGDTAAGRGKLEDVLQRLEKGEDFLSVARQLSDDPSAKDNRGDLYYITVFTLPYELENIIYTTASGTYSKPYRSKAGYHIFKNLGERKALGKIKIQQILIALPPGTDEEGKKQAARLADSLYRRTQAGEDFGKLALAFSHDYISAVNNGTVPDIAVGQYEPAFEKAIRALPANGAVSKPFLTSHGYHIVKRIGLIPVITDSANKTNLEELKQKVTADDRWKSAKDFIYARIRDKGVYEKLPYSEAALWALSDSLLNQQPAGKGTGLNTGSALFKIGNTTVSVSDWIGYARDNRYKADKSIIPYNELMDAFTRNAMYQYYRDHLEDFNEDFRNQMTEFREGNLFFEIMQREVWEKAQSDSLALLALYEKNKSQYNWKPGADAVLFFCADKDVARALSAQVKADPAGWRKITELNDKAATDSGRYEWAQIPGVGKMVPSAGTVTAPAINTLDNTASFAYIIRVHNQSSPRSFEDARGLVMNDYQTLLEEEWIKELKKKYPVVIDQDVLARISK
jgi:peptidyl-prolyl cis-trans isomerase SurA